MSLEVLGYNVGLDERIFDVNLHFNAGVWGALLIFFGYIVIMMDTRNPKKKKRQSIRDRILGIETRYFIVIFNGLLLYGTLLILLLRRNSNDISNVNES